MKQKSLMHFVIDEEDGQVIAAFDSMFAAHFFADAATAHDRKHGFGIVYKYDTTNFDRRGTSGKKYAAVIKEI